MKPTEINIVDRMPLLGVTRTADGHIGCRALAARTGIYEYLASELGMEGDEIIRMYRPEEEVFDRRSMASFKAKAITQDHPNERVTAENWSKYAKGTIMGVARDGEAVALDIAIMDAGLVKAIEDDEGRELSAGYITTIDWTPGTSPEGEAYDAVQRDMFIDHVAVVPMGRAGPEYRIGDAKADKWGASPIITDAGKEKSMALRNIMVDGLQVETTDAGAAAIEKLQADKAKLVADHKTEVDGLNTKIADKDKELGKKDAEIEDLKGKVLDDKAIDQRVADRAKLVADAVKIVPDFKADGLTDADIRRKVVETKVGDGSTKDKSDEYVEARFDAFLDAAPTSQGQGTFNKPVRKQDGADGGWGRALDSAGVGKKEK